MRDKSEGKEAEPDQQGGLLQQVKDPASQQLFEALLAEREAHRQEREEMRLERDEVARGLTGTLIQRVSSWYGRMRFPAMQQMARHALYERYGRGAEDAGTAASGAEHEIRTLYGVILPLLPLVVAHPEAREAVHRGVLRMESVRLRTYYGHDAAVLWETKMQHTLCADLTDQLLRAVTSQAQTAGEKEAEQRKRRRIELDSNFAQGDVRFGQKGGKGGKGGKGKK